MSDSTYVSKPTIGWRLRALRAQQRKTATEMAALLSFTSETQYLDAESGSCVPLERYATLIGRLAVRYGVPVRTLLDDDTAPPSTTSSAGVGQSAQMHVEALSAFVQYMGVSTSFGAGGGGGGAASTTTSSSVGKRLQRLRLERELSIIDVCEAVNVDESFAHENRRLAAALHAVDGPVVAGDPAPSRRSTTTTIMLNADTLSQQQQQQDEAATTTTTTLTVESPGARRASSTAAATAVDASKLTASAAGATTRRRSSAAASQNRRRSSSSSNSVTPRSTDPNKHEHSSSAKRSAAAAAGGASTSDVGGAASHQVAPPPRRSTPPPALTSLSDLHSTAGAYLAATAATDEVPHDNDPLVGGLVTERDMERIEGGAHWLFERWMSVIRTFCTVCRVDPFFLLLGL